ncbi:TetR/AcrR family transcriptional regulator [Isoptericola sp. 4D.3]|uniref:TetR/AcrR family transcriptional regulator n=1 Tax=Isoptericola peretonis TaxID=2918523 RepID=A0ABT0J2H3_9MICO|nr:TetR/AcrR family transcriptional regulator [Isoptericola sp. 4D.3]
MGTRSAEAGDGGRTEAVAPRRGDVRARILDAARVLFYTEGIRAVSADKVIAAAGVSKVTFYRHFPTKDELVVAYLDAIATWERDLLEGLRDEHAGDPAGSVAALAEALGAVAGEPRFRGCAFVNAGAEYADPEHPARAAVARHRAWYTAFLAGLAHEAGADDPAAAAAELMMLRDGAMVCGDVGDADVVGPRLAAGFAAVLAAHRAAADPA